MLPEVIKELPADVIAGKKELTEDMARELKHCPKCGKDKTNPFLKTSGLVVCWSCFKGGKNPFKYFNGTLAEWLKL